MTPSSPFAMMPVEDAVAQVGRGPVPAHVYHDPDWWEAERQSIFMASWLHVGHVCELPDAGSFIRRDLEFANASLLITRGKDGAVRAFHNVCTHRGTQLVADASGKRAQFSCPYHMWTYGADGRLLSAPDFERFQVKKEDCALKAVALEVCAGMIFVNLRPPESLCAFLGPIADALEALPVARATHFTEWTYEVAANWKLNFDNFQENYHLRFIHSRTGEPALGAENPFGYPVSYGFSGPHRSQVLWKNPAPPPLPPTMLAAHQRAAALAAKDGTSWPKSDFKLFPCLHIVGLATNFYSHTMTPLGPDRTRGQVRMYWTGEDDCASRRFTREFTTMSIRDVLCEDRQIIEAGQRGLSSGALTEVHFQEHEVLLMHLHRQVVARVEAWRAKQV